MPTFRSSCVTPETTGSLSTNKRPSVRVSSADAHNIYKQRPDWSAFAQFELKRLFLLTHKGNFTSGPIGPVPLSLSLLGVVHFSYNREAIRKALVSHRRDYVTYLLILHFSHLTLAI